MNFLSKNLLLLCATTVIVSVYAQDADEQATSSTQQVDTMPETTLETPAPADLPAEEVQKIEAQKAAMWALYECFDGPYKKNLAQTLENAVKEDASGSTVSAKLEAAVTQNALKAWRDSRWVFDQTPNCRAALVVYLNGLRPEQIGSEQTVRSITTVTGTSGFKLDWSGLFGK